MDIGDLLIRIVEVEKSLENYREYRTAIEDLETDVMYIKQEIENIKEHLIKYHQLMLGTCPIELEKTIKENMRGKSPHKCPVCEGNCMRPNPLRGSENAMLPVNLDCIVCEGKGIVWG